MRGESQRLTPTPSRSEPAKIRAYFQRRSLMGSATRTSACERRIRTRESECQRSKTRSSQRQVDLDLCRLRNRNASLVLQVTVAVLRALARSESQGQYGHGRMRLTGSRATGIRCIRLPMMFATTVRSTLVPRRACCARSAITALRRITGVTVAGAIKRKYRLRGNRRGKQPDYKPRKLFAPKIHGYA